MNSDYIRFLDEIGKHDTAFAGGKGANLGEIFRARLPVPPAFVVTTKAHEVFSKSHGLEEKIERILSRIDVDDFENLEKGAAEIRRIVESSALPGEVSRVVGLAYEELCRRSSVRNLPVAVRSSATMEDLREASFAGQQVTLLNVRGKKAILSAIRKCWASVYTARATFYRVKKGFGSHSIPTAVVVQRQVSSQKAGVGFTLHPLTGNREVIVIEGGYGQGEDVVSGRATPDTFVIDKKSGRLIESRIAHKASMKTMSRAGSGLVTVKVSKSLREKPCLTEEELKKLWRIGRALEEHYEYPQDFE